MTSGEYYQQQENISQTVPDKQANSAWQKMFLWEGKIISIKKILIYYFHEIIFKIIWWHEPMFVEVAQNEQWKTYF